MTTDQENLKNLLSTAIELAEFQHEASNYGYTDTEPRNAITIIFKKLTKQELSIDAFYTYSRVLEEAVSDGNSLSGFTAELYEDPTYKIIAEDFRRKANRLVRQLLTHGIRCSEEDNLVAYKVYDRINKILSY